MGAPAYVFGQFVLHPGRQLLRDGKAVVVGNRALQVLETMLAADGGVVTKSELMSKAWPGLVVEDGNITVQVASLRKELGTRPDGQDWIVTVPRVGYRFVRDSPPVTGSRKVAVAGPPLPSCPSSTSAAGFRRTTSPMALSRT